MLGIYILISFWNSCFFELAKRSFELRKRIFEFRKCHFKALPVHDSMKKTMYFFTKNHFLTEIEPIW